MEYCEKCKDEILYGHSKQYPDQQNNDAMADLHQFIENWRKFWKLTALQEIQYLSLMAAGRAEVQHLLNKCKEWPDKYPDGADGL